MVSAVLSSWSISFLTTGFLGRTNNHHFGHINVAGLGVKALLWCVRYFLCCTFLLHLTSSPSRAAAKAQPHFQLMATMRDIHEIKGLSSFVIQLLVPIRNNFSNLLPSPINSLSYNAKWVFPVKHQAETSIRADLLLSRNTISTVLLLPALGQTLQGWW